jgi:hypothetical protein
MLGVEVRAERKVAGYVIVLGGISKFVAGQSNRHFRESLRYFASGASESKLPASVITELLKIELVRNVTRTCSFVL